MNEEIIGIGAGIFTSASLVPQLFKIVKEKKAENISYFMLGILLAGLAGWIWYGALKKDLPILVTNCFSLVVNIVTLFFTFKFKKKG